MSGSETIQRLLDQVEELHVHPRNQANLKKWVSQPKHGRDRKWRGVAAPVDTAAGQIPIVVNTELSLKSAILGFSVGESFHNPEVYLENYLKYVIYRFTETQDDVPVLLHIPLSLWPGADYALWGCEVFYKDDDDPVRSPTPLLEDLSQVDGLPMPDFNQGPIAAFARQLYEYVCEQTRGRDFTAACMEWVRSAFGLAPFLYGEDEWFTALTFDPEGAHRLLNHISQARIKWTRQRAAYLGEEEYVTAGMYADKVSGINLTPQGYLEFVRPYVMAIVELHGGINYWHGCGDTTKLLKELGELPIELFHVGPWTDVQKAAEQVGSKGTALEICVQKYKRYGPLPIPAADHALLATPQDIEGKIRDTVRQAVEGGATAFALVAGPFGIRPGVERDPKKVVKAIERWVRTSRTVLADLDD